MGAYFALKFYSSKTEREQILLDETIGDAEDKSSLLLKEDADTTESAGTSQHKKSQEEFNGYLLAIPAMFYLVSCVLQNTALSKINPSTFMLLRSSLMVFTAILEKIFISKQLYAQHWLAMLTVATGLAIVSYLASVHGEDKGEDKEALSSSSRMWYIFLVLVSQLCMACQYITETHFLENYTLDPLYMIGI